MPDSAMETVYDLRLEGHAEELDAAVDAFIKDHGRDDFTCRDLAESCQCNMAQARRALNARIADGVLEYEGATRDMVYRKAPRKR